MKKLSKFYIDPEKNGILSKLLYLHLYFSGLPQAKRAQILIAVILTILVPLSFPTYSWFRLQRQLARYEKISSPNSLYITAGHRENPIYFDIGAVDVTGNWKEAGGS